MALRRYVVTWMFVLVALAAIIGVVVQHERTSDSTPASQISRGTAGMSGRSFPGNHRESSFTIFLDNRIAHPSTSVYAEDETVFIGLHGGDVLRLSLSSKSVAQQPTPTMSVERIGKTGGRPEGIALHPSGRLVIADSQIGLISMITKGKRSGQIDVLTNSSEGLDFKRLKDVVVSQDGRTAYFLDAVDGGGKWAPGKRAPDGYQGTSRLVAYNFEARSTRTLLSNLIDVTGIALSSDARFLLINEGAAQRITRYWLAGDLVGQSEIFISDIDQPASRIRATPQGEFLMVLPGQRNAALDLLTGHPFLTHVTYQVLDWLNMRAGKSPKILFYDPQGTRISVIEWTSAQYFNINEAIVVDDSLLVSSPKEQGVAFTRLISRTSPCELLPVSKTPC